MNRAASLGAWLAAALLLGYALPCMAATGAPPKIVLIGGSGSEGPGRHEYARGVERLAALLRAWARMPGSSRVVISSHPGGWPTDPRAFDGAATLLLYADGDHKHPLLDPARRQQFKALMHRGVGLVALHQASTVPAGDAQIDLLPWLGGARFGLYDRSTETATLQPVTPTHPVSRGVAAFAYRDEFYPTLRFSGRGVVPVLAATLHVQYRDGHAIVEDLPEQVPVAWAYERAGGGRAFGFTGGHFLAALDQPMLRKTLLNAVLWTAGIEVPAHGVELRAEAGHTPIMPIMPTTPLAPTPSDFDAPTFHHDAQRSGWNRHETTLTAAGVAGATFGPTWASPPLDSVDGQPPRLYASPLYIDRLRISAGQHQGETFSVVVAATSNGHVYAINTRQAADVAAGRVLWRTRLAAPCRLQPAPLDGVPTGVLSTPVIDVPRQRLYVTHCDPQQRWQAYALDLGSGAVLPGWPVRLDEAALNAVNRNAGPVPVPPKRRFDFRVQRGALNLSPDGSRLYVVFGETETGWLVSVDTVQARIASAFAAVAMPHRGSGGLWGAGGPAVDAAGQIYVVTGTGFDGYLDQPNDWTQSLLKLSDKAPDGLQLQGTYTPFNHCVTAKMDIDLGSGGAMLLPEEATTARLLVIGGKQGNAYLLDREQLPGRLDRRPACSSNAASDGSLLPPQDQPQFGSRGPLSVFGPYSEEDAALDTARARSLPAAYRAADGRVSVFMTGNTRAGPGSAVAVAPSLVRLQVVTGPAGSPYLRLERRQDDIVFGNPGSPVVSSNGGHEGIVWVLDENARRSALLSGAGAPAPVLHAFDAQTLALLWQSAPGALHTSGKYNEPLVVRGQVLVGTDRIQAFGLVATRPAPTATALATGSDVPAIFRQRCAACHDNPQGNVPPRALIARRTQAQIVEALSQGVMRAQAEGLAAQDIEALARWVRSESPP